MRRFSVAIANVTGTDDRDILFTGSGDDTIEANGGDDLIFTQGGDNVIDAGSGDDLVYAGSGDDLIFGAEGRDLLYGGAGSDTIDGGAGRDYINAGAGDDTLIFTLSENTATANTTPDRYNGNSGFDTLCVNLTAAEFAAPGLVEELSEYLDDLDAGAQSSGYVWLESINLMVLDIEAMQIFVDGVLVDPRDTGGGGDIEAVDDGYDITENGSLSESVAANDTAPAGATFTLLSPVANGTLLLNNDGTFTYDPGTDYDALTQGATATETFTYQVTSGADTETATATITITGTNDAPTVEAALSFAADEDAATGTIDLLDGASDADTGAVLSVINVTGLTDGVTLSGTQVTVDPADAAFQSLAVGETTEITLGFDVIDGLGGVVAQTATITITGTNDAPTVGAALSAATTEDGASVAVDLLDGATDVDTSDTLSVQNVTGLTAGVTLAGSVVTVDPADAAFQSLAQGEELVLSLGFDVVDGQGGSVAQTATITLTGTNDVPTVEAALDASAASESPAFELDLLDGAEDVDNGAVLSVQNVTGLTAGVTLSGTTVTVDPSDAAFAELGIEDAVIITLTFDVVDEFGGSVAQTATVTITGSNNDPIITGAVTADAAEDDASFVVDLLEGAFATAIDTNLSVQNLTGLVPGVTVSGASATVDPTDPAFQSLAVGDSQEIVLNYDIVDDFGGSVAQTATITITGTNDAPTVGAAVAGDATEDGASLTVDLLDGASDVDAGAVLSVQNVTGLTAQTVLSGTEVTIDPSDAAFQSLAEGETAIITLTYDVVDDQGATTPQTATITVTGTNDAPTVGAALSATAAEDDAAFTIDLLDGAGDVDNFSVLSVANVTGLTEGVSVLGSTLFVDPGDAAFQSLAQGDSIDIVVSYDVTDAVIDGVGETVPQMVTITLTGTNDAPTVAGVLNQGAVVNAESVDLDLLDGAEDVDDGAVLTVENVVGLVPGLTLVGTTLTIDPSASSFSDILPNDTLPFFVTYDVVDEFGAAVSQTAIISISGGVNGPPTVSGEITVTENEDTSAFTIDLLEGASDPENDVLSVANLTGLVPGVTLNGTNLNVDPSGANFQALTAGEEIEIVVTYDVVDVFGASVPQTATITITGANDTPVVAAELSAAANEDDAAFAIDLLDGVSDVDTGAVLSVTNVSGLSNGASVVGSTLNIDPSDASLQALAAGDTQEITISYDVTDEFGASVSQTATVTITGTNDVPTFAAALTAAANEDDAGFTVDLLDGASDADSGAVLSVENVTGLSNGATVSGNTLSVNPSDASLQALAVGETLDITVSYDVTDDQGASVAQTATVTITGTNDAPTVAAVLTAGANEDDASFTVDLLDGADDVDNGAVLSVANVTGLSSGVTLAGTTLSVDPSDASLQALSAGETLDIVVNYDVTDEHGASEAQTATVTITGTNDAPTVAAALTAAANEDDGGLTVDLLGGADDVDNGAVLTVENVTGLTNGASVLGSTLSVDPSDASLQALAEGETLDITVSYDVTDDQGASVAQTATVTITGTNDAPTVEAELSETAEEDDESFTLDLLDGADDIDNGAVLSVVNVTGLTAGVTLDGSVLTVAPGDAAFQSLAVEETREITIAYDVEDEFGASVEQTATIFVIGTNDTPTVAAALTAAANEDGATFTVDLLDGATDVDNGAFLSVVNVTGLTNGASVLDSTLSVDPSDASLQALADGETLDIVVNYDVEDEYGASVAQTATVTITGTNDAPTVAAALSAAANEDDASFTVDLLDGAADIDNGAVLSVQNVSGLTNGVSVTGSTLSVDPSDASLQALADGETLDIVVSYDVEDEFGASVGQSATVTITGTNDTPTVTAALTAGANEDDGGLTVDLLQGAADVDNGAVLSVQNVTGLSNGASVSGSTLSVDPSDASLQSLAQGETLDIAVSYEVADEFGATVAQTATVTITGTNDAPTVAAALNTSANEDDASFTLDLLDGAADVDNGAVLGVQNITGLSGGLTVLGSTLTVDPADAAFQPIAQGEQVDIQIDYEVVDEFGATVAQTATVTIFGTNDVPVVLGSVDTQLVTSGQAYSLTLDPDLFFDIDASDVLTLSATLEDGSPLPAWLTFDPATQTFSGTVPDDANASLIRIAVTATDPFGASAVEAFWLGQGDAILEGVSPDSETVANFASNTSGEILLGGEGTDLLVGRDRSDVYVVTTDNATTVIDDNGFRDDDVLLLDDLNLADVTLGRHHSDSNDLAIYAGGVLVALINEGLNGSGGDEVETLAFEDGTVLTMGDIREMILEDDQGATDDLVRGFDFAETLDGGSGNDMLIGEDASDTYVFEIGDGQDTVRDDGFGDFDEVVFADRSSTDATFSRPPDNLDSLLISFANGDSVLLIGGVGTNAVTRIEEVIFQGDGVTLLTQDLRDLLIAQSETAGDDTIVGFATEDTIEAGTGNDLLNGGDASDLYIFNIGDGQDTVDETGFADTDVVRFTDYELADATITRDQADSTGVIIDFGGGDVVTLRNTFNEAASGGIDQVIFAGSGADEVLTDADLRGIILAGEETAGNDRIISNVSLPDTLEGGAGDDFMSGGDGADTYIFGVGDGRDVIDDSGFGDADVLDMSDFVSTDATIRFVYGTTTDVVISMTTGEEVTILDIIGNGGGIAEIIFADTTLTTADVLAAATTNGPAGDEFIGGSDAETLSGDGGFDFLSGNNNADTYTFEAGDGRIDIDESGNGAGDLLEINGFLSSQAEFVRIEGLPNDLLIRLDSGEEIVIRNGLSNSFAAQVETIVFTDDGVSFDMNTVRQLLVDDQGTAADDFVFGYIGSETLEGGLGDDVLSGLGSGDTYLFASGDGNDTIDDLGGGGGDVLIFGDYELADASFERVPGTSADVIVSFAGGDSVTIVNTLNDAFSGAIETITFNGTGAAEDVTMADLRNLLALQDASAGDDVISGTSQAETLNGGLGDDYLSGQGSGDTYIYALGDGNDTIRDSGGGGGDALEVQGILSTDAVFTRAPDDINALIITMPDGGSVRIEGTLASAFADAIDTITFVADGVSFDMLDMRNIIFANEATAGDDLIQGFSQGDTLFGGQGDDYLTGGGGSDTYVFNIGDGNDIAEELGGGGNDGFVFTGRDIADATFTRFHDGSNDLLVSFDNGDSVLVLDTLTSSFSQRFEFYEFEDGTLTAGDVLALL